MAQFSLHVHKGGLKPDSFQFVLLCIAQLSLDTPVILK